MLKRIIPAVAVILLSLAGSARAQITSIGHYSVGGNNNGMSANSLMTFGPFTAPSSGTLASVSCYINNAANLTMGVYADNGSTYPGALVANGSGAASGTYSGGQWVTCNMPGALIVSGSKYWLSYYSSSLTYLYYTAGSDNNYGLSKSYSASVMPSTYTAGAANNTGWQWSIYANYVASTASAGTVVSFLGSPTGTLSSGTLNLTCGTTGYTSGGTLQVPAAPNVLNTALVGFSGSGGLTLPGSVTVLAPASGGPASYGVAGTGSTGSLTPTASLMLTGSVLGSVSGTWNAANLSAGTVDNGVVFGLSSTGSDVGANWNTSLSGSGALIKSGTVLESLGVSVTGTLSSGGTLDPGWIASGHILAGSGTGTYTVPPLASIMATAGAFAYAGSGSIGTLAVANSDLWSGVVAYTATGSLSVSGSQLVAGNTVHGITGTFWPHWYTLGGGAAALAAGGTYLIRRRYVARR